MQWVLLMQHNRRLHSSSELDKAFGQAVREFRERKNVSQERLAREGGIDRVYLSMIERGMVSPTIRKVMKIAAVLKISPSTVVRRMEQLLKTQKSGSTPELVDDGNIPEVAEGSNAPEVGEGLD
jgi:transcriptional regulator with XRE-family HTH domain